MSGAVLKSISYVFIIIMGVFLKHLKILKKEDSQVLSKISVRFTLPAAVFLSFHNFVFQHHLLMIMVFGLGVNLFLVGLSLILDIKKERKAKVVGLMNNSSFNVGSFALPYIVSQYPPAAIIYASMFDIGNSIYSMGLNLAIANELIDKDKKFNLKAFIKTLFSSVPFMVYLIMLITLILKIQFPEPLFQILEVVGNANIFIVMLMFGLIFEWPDNKLIVKDSFRILFIRYFLTSLIVFSMWYFFGFYQGFVQVLTICIYAPMSSIIPSFLMELGFEPEVSSLTSSLSILISIAIYSLLFSIW